jgi:hypothetical protein
LRTERPHLHRILSLPPCRQSRPGGSLRGCAKTEITVRAGLRLRPPFSAVRVHRCRLCLHGRAEVMPYPALGPVRGSSAYRSQAVRRVTGSGPGKMTGVTVVCLVQHGEKEPGPGDPGLTELGRRFEEYGLPSCSWQLLQATRTCPMPRLRGGFPGRFALARRPAHLRLAGPQLMTGWAGFRLVLEQGGGATRPPGAPARRARRGRCGGPRRGS